MRDRLFLCTALAASILAGLGTPPATAATVNQLPGQGRVVSGHVSVGTLDTGAGTMSLDVSGPSVINWGRGTARTDINAGGVAGFNIGADAHVNFNGTAGAAVLNIDSSGNPSQIFGTLTAHGTDVFVANGNGILVGAHAQIASDRTVGLIANRLLAGAAAGFDGSAGSIAYDGSGGDVVVRQGASVGGAQVLIAGGGNVNVDLGAFGGSLRLSAGRAAAGAGGSDNHAATLTVSGVQRGTVTGFDSAGFATNLGTLRLTRARIDRSFLNRGTLDLANGFAIGGRLVNQNLVDAHGHVTLGRLVNSGTLNTRGWLDVRGPLANTGRIVAPSYRGTVSARGRLTNDGLIAGVSAVSVRGDLVNTGLITLVDRTDFQGDVGTVAVTGGDLVNRGRIRAAAGSNAARDQDLALQVTNGSIANAGTLADFGDIQTGSDPGRAGFHAGDDYSIVNSGTIRGDAVIDANFLGRSGDNGSTGSFVNTGVLDVRSAGTGTGRELSVAASNDVSLGGTVLADGQALGAGNALDGVSLNAYDGTLTVATPLTFFSDGQNSGTAYLQARQARFDAGVTGLGAGSRIYLSVTQRSDGSYDYSLAPGAQLQAGEVHVSPRL